MSNNPIAQRIEAQFASMTPTFKKVATYILANLDYLPYETAETISHAVGVSGVTVGRFFRSLNFKNIEDVKHELRANDVKPWLVTDRYAAQQQHVPDLDHALQREIEAIQHAHSLRQSAAFQRIVHHLVHADAVFVIGVQSMRGIMNHFFALLEYLRPRVYYAEGSSGTYLESLNSEIDNPYIITSDMRAYAKQTKRLCQAAAEQSLPFALITDVYCPWAHELDGDVLMVRTETGQFWDSLSPLVSVLNLLLSEVALQRGGDLKGRLEKNKQLQAFFGQFEA